MFFVQSVRRDWGDRRPEPSLPWALFFRYLVISAVVGALVGYPIGYVVGLQG